MKRRKKTVYGYYHERTCANFNLEQSKNILDFIKELHPQNFCQNGEYRSNDTFIKLTDKGWTKDNAFYKVSNLYKMTPWSFREKILKYVSLDDAMMSFNSYISPSSKKSELYYITMLVVDIDYHNTTFVDHLGRNVTFMPGTQEEWQFNRVMYLLENDHFGYDLPIPTYIERGHNIRLYYVFESPIFIANNVKFCRFIQQVQDKFADRVAYLGGDHQQINSYIRMAGSFNTKMGMRHAYEIELLKYKDGRKYTWDDICEYIPDKPDWKKTRTKVRKMRRYSPGFIVHNNGVLKDLESAQRYYNDMECSGHREKFAHLYLNFLLLNNEDFDSAIKKTIEFNNNWNNPIPERKLRTALNNQKKKTYQYSNATLRDIVGNGPKVSTICGRGKMSVEERKLYNKEYYEKNGKKKHQKTEKRREKILNIVEELKKSGASNTNIVKELAKRKIKLAVKTVESYVTKLIKLGRYSAKLNFAVA